MGRPPGWVTQKTGRAPLPSPRRPPVSSREQRRQFWVLIAAGRSSEQAAESVGVSAPVGSRWFRHAGGMAPLPWLPCRAGTCRSGAGRDRGAARRGHGVRQIAAVLHRSPSTISRELRRNAATRGGRLDYRASVAQWHSELRARRPKRCKLAIHEPLREYVQERLSGLVTRPDGATVPGPAVRWIGRRHGRRQDRRWARAWSPEQIAHRLRVDFPDDGSMRVSHEAIYQALYVQGRGALRRDLVACLRTGRALRVPRARTRGRARSSSPPRS